MLNPPPRFRIGTNRRHSNPIKADRLRSLVRSCLRAWPSENCRLWFTASSVAGLVVVIRLFGLLQSSELAALDQLVRLRPLEPTDDRIVIVGIDDADINAAGSWPIPDAQLTLLLEKIKAASPRAIGLDIYRDLPVEPGYEALQGTFRETPNLIGIEKIPDQYSIGVQPPKLLERKDQIGFNNVLVDPDGRVRRSLLFWTVEGEPHMSFSLRLALLYLQERNISPQAATRGNPSHLQLGEAVFRPLGPNDGGYVRTDNGGYQVLINFRKQTSAFHQVSMTEVMEGKVAPEVLRDRIVLVGSTANSLQDFFYTPFSTLVRGGNQVTPGVELHAQFISQILSAVLDERSLIGVWPDPVEWLWILVWSVIGAHISWIVRSPGKVGLVLLVAVSMLGAIAFLAFLAGWWIPTVPPMVALVGSAVGITSYIAHLEGEMQKSKEFLNSVINTIPDPIFVKDKQHRWIVLNEAYSRFIGHTIEELLGKDERDFLPAHQAEALRSQDNLAFQSHGEQEREGELTNAKGHTYQVSIKRSLHRDAAGNQFLVGVIHDITQRKRMEDELRRTAAELVRSNAELRQTGAHLRQIAYHDPLTGLPNRKLFQERLIQAIEWAEYNEQLIAILFLDLDGFKTINDSEGHLIGDLLLQAVAKRLSGCLRSSDTVARLGGDEFVVILPAIPSEQHAGQVARKILLTLGEAYMLRDKTISITTSIGISMYPHHANSIETLIVGADQAMYRAKEMGKNRFEFMASPATASNLSSSLASEQKSS